jgi:hypothetical protein
MSDKVKDLKSKKTFVSPEGLLMFSHLYEKQKQEGPKARKYAPKYCVTLRLTDAA